MNDNSIKIDGDAFKYAMMTEGVREDDIVVMSVGTYRLHQKTINILALRIGELERLLYGELVKRPGLPAFADKARP